MNLKGGYKIIDICALSLVAGVVGGDAIEITDKGVLDQLLSLKEFLDVEKELKPILLRAKQSGKEVVMGELLRDDAGKLHIIALLKFIKTVSLQ